MTANSISKSRTPALFCGAVILSLLVTPLPATVSDEPEDVPWQLRQELSSVLASKASKIAQEKNEKGERFQRAGFSKRFIKVDDATYKVTFTRDTASEERMRTERFLLTLVKSSGKWEVTEEQLEGTYEKLVREKPGDEKFYTFDKFALAREGFTVDATNGTAIVDYLLGEPDQILITSDEVLEYGYKPPVELSFHQRQVYEYLKREKQEDFDFRPSVVVIDCDATSCREFLDTTFSGLEEATQDVLDPELRKFFNDAVDDQRKFRHDYPFGGFRVPYEPQRRSYTVSVKRDDHDQWVKMYFDNEAAWEVNFAASEYGPLFGYPSEETRNSGIQPYDLELRDDYDARLYQLTGLVGTVEVGVEEPEMVRADVTFTMKTKRELEEIPFALNSVRGIGGSRTSDKRASITVNDLRDAETGEELTWVRIGGSGGWVILNEKVPANTEIKVRMAFQTKGSIRKLTPSYAYMDRSGWLPFVRFTDAIEDFEMTVKAPSDFKTLGVGTKMDESKKGDVTTTTWKAFSPVKFPTIIFGDYIEDSPKTVAKKFDGTEIPVTIHVDKHGMEDWQIRPKQLRPLAEQAVNALNIYREIYGMDYPYGKLDLVNDPLGFLYGQAPASVIYLGSGAFKAEATLAAMSGGSAGYIAEFTDSLVAHEVAHQWWGSLIGNANQRNYWFVESLAEYSAAIFLEIVEGEGYAKPEKAEKAYRNHIAGWRKEILETDLLSSVQDASVVWSGPGGGGYRAAVYSKGPYAFHILRTTFGDEKFFAFLKTMGTELAGREIVTRDIQRVAEESFGGTMEWFFDQWIRGIGIPEYSFNYTYRASEDGNYIVEGNVKQRVVAGLQKEELEDVFYRGIVPVIVLGRDKQEYPARLLVEGGETPFAFKVPVEPLEIELNKYGEILAHPTLENRSW